MEPDEFRAKLREALSKRIPVQVPRVEVEEATTSTASDSDASKEATAIASGDLDSASAQREHNRTERFRDNVAIAILIVFWIGFAALLLAALLWLINFFQPDGRHFLSDDQSGKIFSFLTGSGVTGFIGNYAKKRLT